MVQPGPSWRIVASEIIESPESPQSPDNLVENVPRVGVEIPLGIGSESSSEDEYEEPSSEEEKIKVDEKNGPVNNNPPIEYGFDDDYVGDDHFTLYTRRDVHALKGWSAFVLERHSCAGFLFPEPPIPERLHLVRQAINGVNWQRSVLSGSRECKIEMLSAAIIGYSITTDRERREFLRLFGAWANVEFRAGLRDLAAGGGFLRLEESSRESFVGVGAVQNLVFYFGLCAACWYIEVGIAQTSFLKS